MWRLQNRQWQCFLQGTTQRRTLSPGHCTSLASIFSPLLYRNIILFHFILLRDMILYYFILFIFDSRRHKDELEVLQQEVDRELNGKIPVYDDIPRLQKCKNAFLVCLPSSFSPPSPSPPPSLSYFYIFLFLICIYLSLLQESLRLRPPVPQLERITANDCTLGGYPVPAGTTLFLSIH